jgi:hypothetical protein
VLGVFCASGAACNLLRLCTPPETDLEMAERHVLRGEAIIEQQRVLILRLGTAGASTAEAENLLDLFQSLQAEQRGILHGLQTKPSKDLQGYDGLQNPLGDSVNDEEQRLIVIGRIKRRRVTTKHLERTLGQTSHISVVCRKEARQLNQYGRVR